ncbi:MAG TPA: GldG family protein [Verrucomicrobiota bacterium]|nr:GldG family protein [Verrucomicrobiota bacterium]HNT14487.1 GldG family protein [Verrucomicrobiota bacterium]
MAAAPHPQPSFTPRRRWSVGLNLALRTLFVVMVLTLLNQLAGVFFHRQYLSRATRVELSERTRHVIASVTNDVHITIYYDREDEFYPTVAALLREYQALNPRLHVETVDYVRDAGRALEIKREFDLPESSKDDEKNFVIFKSGPESRFVPGSFLTDTTIGRDRETGELVRRATAFKGETAFTAMLLWVSHPKPLKAYVLQGHGEHNIDGSDEITGYLGFKSLLQQNAIRVEPLSLTGTNAIPADCALLVIPGPRSPIPDLELKKIGQYLDDGGRLFALFNSFTTEADSGLEALLAKQWHVVVTDSVVIDPAHAINSLKMAPGRDVTIAAFSEHPVVRGLLNYQLNLLAPRALGEKREPRRAAPDPVSVQTLFATEPTARLVNNPRIPPQSFVLAVAVEQQLAPGIIAPRGRTRMVIVGDSFFLANEHLNKFPANRDFAYYAVNWLLDRPQFTEGIGPKPFTEFRVVLTEQQMVKLRWLLLGALPGGILLFGALVWWRRRK